MPRRSWPALLFLIALAPVLRAQSSNASLNGRTTDPDKAVIVKANVAAFNLGTNVRYETTTNAEGEYYLTSLPRGLYRIEIEKSALKKLIKSALSLHVHGATERDFELTLSLMSDEPGLATASQQNAANRASAKPQTGNDIANDPASRLAWSNADRTIVRKGHERTDENEYGYGGRN